MQKVKDGEVHKVKADVTREVIGRTRSSEMNKLFDITIEDKYPFILPLIGYISFPYSLLNYQFVKRK